MSSRPMLNGQVLGDQSALLREIEELRKSNDQLKTQLDRAQESLVAVVRERDEAHAAVNALREQTLPLFSALQMLHGLMDQVPSGGAATTASSTASSSKWEGWKARLGGKSAEIIDVLLLNGTMSINQISKALSCHYNTAQEAIKKMREMGILTVSRDGVTLKGAA